MRSLDWNRERYRTRDRLLEYDFSIVPAAPHSAELSMIYPWEDMLKNQLSYQIYSLAQAAGYQDSEENFWNHFSTAGGIILGTVETFPIPGKENHLYLDGNTEILYYFKVAGSSIAEDVAEQVGAVVVGTEDDKTFLYIPVRALPIEPSILDCDNSTII